VRVVPDVDALEAAGLQVVVTGSVGSGKSWWVGRLIGAYGARRRRLVILDRSDQHAALVGARLVLDRAVVGRSLDWRAVLDRARRVLVRIDADPADVLPHLAGLAHTLWEVGDTLLVAEEAQRWTPAVGGARPLALLATDARKRGIDWIVVSPELVHRQRGVASEWVRESMLRVTFSIEDPRQVELLEDLVPAWRGQVGALRIASRDPAGALTPGEYLVYDRRSRAAARVDLASGAVDEVGSGHGENNLNFDGPV